MTCEEIAAELRATLALYEQGRGFMQRKQSLTAMYEFVEEDSIRPYHVSITRGLASFDEGALSYDDCDIVVRTTPLTLHKVLQGELGGREAVMSGTLNIRKAPSMVKLMVLRSLFNRYTKARKRGEIGTASSFSPEVAVGGVAAEDEAARGIDR